MKNLARLLARQIVLLLCLIGGASMSSAAETEYLSDVFAERVFYFTQGWGELGLDTCAHARNQTPLALRIKDKRYEKGLGHHAPGEIFVDLNGEYEAFLADVGVQWQQGTTGTVVFQVFVDGEKRFDSGVMHETDEPRSVRVSLKGAEELRLVVTDAGDGITCDCADWANARLVRTSAAGIVSSHERFDAAPFARVVTFDPARKDGTHATRVQEFPAEDVFLSTELLPNRDKTYTVPFYPNGKSCIGLEWAERRELREIAVEFAENSAIPAAQKTVLEYWEGESPWQGQWRRFPGKITKKDRRLNLQIDLRKQFEILRLGTLKIRWIFTTNGKAVRVRRLTALTNSRLKEAKLLLERDRPQAGQVARVEVYNGTFADPSTPDPLVKSWDLSSSLRVILRYTYPIKTDRTVLRFRLPSGAVAVAVDDVIKRGRVYIPDIGLSVAREPVQTTLAAYREQLRARKTVLQRVREMPDQTFEQAIAHVHRDVQNNGPVMLSLTCDNRKFIVNRDGTFGPYGGSASRHFAFRVIPRPGVGNVAWSGRHLWGGWLPVPEVRAEEKGVVYRERAFVVPFGPRDEKKLSPWWYPRPLFIAEFSIRNDNAQAADVALELGIAIDDEKLSAATLEIREAGAALRLQNKLLLFIETPKMAQLHVRLKNRSLILSGQLAAGASAKCRAYVPGWESTFNERPPFLDQALTPADVKSYWSDLFATGMSVNTPDELLNNVIRASQVYCLMAARNEQRGERIAPWIASDRYGPLESEGHSIVLGMDAFGHHDFARRCLDFYIRRYNKQGFLTTGYTLMGTGWHLWTLAEHYRLTRDEAWLKANAGEIARVCRWIVAQCKKTQKKNARGEKVPEYGFFPPGVVADWNLFSYRFFLEGHFYAGLHGAAQVLSDIGWPGADELLASAAAFRKELLRGYDWEQRRVPAMPLSTGAFIPGVPAILYCHGRVGDMFPGADGNRSWAGDVEIGPHHLVPLGVVKPQGRQAQWMSEILEDYWFLQSGMGEYPEEENRRDWFNLGGFAKIQPYYGRLIEIHALRDDVKPFIRCYFNAIPSLLNLETLSFWEHFHNRGAWNKTHETGWFLWQTRLMFVMERGDELWLAPFVTNNWLKDGMSVSVRNAPTRFGAVSYRLRSRLKEGVIEAEIDPPRRIAPTSLVLRVRHPEGKRMKSVTVNGQPHKDFDPARAIIRLKPMMERINIKVRY